MSCGDLDETNNISNKGKLDLFRYSWIMRGPPCIQSNDVPIYCTIMLLGMFMLVQYNLSQSNGMPSDTGGNVKDLIIAFFMFHIL